MHGRRADPRGALLPLMQWCCSASSDTCDVLHKLFPIWRRSQAVLQGYGMSTATIEARTHALLLRIAGSAA